MSATKTLGDIEWIALARAKNDERPALAGIHVDRERNVVEATDGHRIHYIKRESVNLAAGLYRYIGKNGLVLGEQIEARFPSTGQVIPNKPWDLQFKDIAEAAAVCAMSIAYNRALELPPLVGLADSSGPRAAVSAYYLQDILKGYAERSFPSGYVPLCLSISGPLYPLTFRGGNMREAVLMPVRVAEVDKRFSVEVTPV